THGLTIANNTLIRNPASAGETENKPLWTPQIRVAETSRDVAVRKNAAFLISGEEGQDGWIVEDNLAIQDVTRLRSWFYDTVFTDARTGDPRDITSFRYLPGGPLDGAGVGASWLGTNALTRSPFLSD
ncbi:MAG: hypothetical protein ACRCU5_10630, partial [Rhizobiaceae bacterium]